MILWPYCFAKQMFKLAAPDKFTDETEHFKVVKLISHHFKKVDNFCDFLFAFMYTRHILKMELFHLEIISQGFKFFSSIADLFSGGSKIIVDFWNKEHTRERKSKCRVYCDSSLTALQFDGSHRPWSRLKRNASKWPYHKFYKAWLKSQLPF